MTASLPGLGQRSGVTHEADQPPSRSYPDDDTGPLLAPSASKQIAQRLGVHTMTVTAWKRDEEFKVEYEKQLSIYRNDFEDIRLVIGISGNPM